MFIIFFLEFKIILNLFFVKYNFLLNFVKFLILFCKSNFFKKFIFDNTFYIY
jgi:hypothetical protein